MKTFFLSLLALATACGTAMAAPADKTYELNYEYKPGEMRTYTSVHRVERSIEAADEKRTSAIERTIVRQELILSQAKEGPEVTMAVFDVPTERQVEATQDGQDLLAEIPEERLTRPLPPTLSIRVLEPGAPPPAEAAELEDPSQAVGDVLTRLRALPPKPVQLGDTWSTPLDLGILKGTLTTRFTEIKEVGGTPCAILEADADVAFTGEVGKRMEIRAMTMTSAEALDGSGNRSGAGEVVFYEKTDEATQQSRQTFTSKLTDMTVVSDDRLAKAKADISLVRSALEQVQAGQVQQGLEILQTYIKNNPEGVWTPAVRSMHASLLQQRLMTQPVPAGQLRMMLKNLQVAHDRATSQGQANETRRIAATLAQLVHVNFETVMEEAASPDPVVRELAAFALGFSGKDEAHARLIELAADSSARVRGSAALGLAFQGKPVELELLTKLLEAEGARTRGAAAILAMRVLEPDTPAVTETLPKLLANLQAETEWARANTLVALARLAPKGSKDVVEALIQGHKAESNAGVQALFLRVLKDVTGVEADTIEAYESWLAKPPEPKG